MSQSQNDARAVPRLYHAIAAGFVAWCVWMARQRPDAYAAAMQEDRVIEWMSVVVFAAAGIALLVRAVRKHRPFDALVALFLLFVAGEEMSWGQRLLGLTPPSYFLEHNTQQEMNVHNFANIFGGPKWPFVLVLIGFAVLMPVLALSAKGRALLSRIGATPPPLAAVPWFLAAIIFFVWYPFRFTGEWTELLAGSAFLVSVGVSGTALAAFTPVALLAAVGLSAWTGRGSTDPVRATCATAEVGAIAAAVHAETLGPGDAHKRVWTMVEEGRIDADTLQQQLNGVRCDDSSAATRRRFGIDPWGTAYWIRVTSSDSGTATTVYSFGPNRRRDIDVSASKSGDDVFIRRAESAR